MAGGGVCSTGRCEGHHPAAAAAEPDGPAGTRGGSRGQGTRVLRRGRLGRSAPTEGGVCARAGERRGHELL